MTRTLATLRRDVLAPALALLPPNMTSPAAEADAPDTRKPLLLGRGFLLSAHPFCSPALR